MPAWIPAAISGAANLFGNLFGNNRNRKNSNRIYDRQRADSLEDWHRNNTYNSPQAQMKRFQDAGLNPNLIYGQGNSGPSQAIPTSDAPNPDFNTPDVNNLLEPFNDFADVRIKKQQTDNLKLQADQITAQTALTAAQEMAAIAGTQQTDQNRQFQKTRQEAITKADYLKNEQTYFQTDKMLADSARSERKQTDDFKTSKLTRKLLENQDALQAYDVLKNQMKAKGLKITKEQIKAILKKFKLM